MFETQIPNSILALLASEILLVASLIYTNTRYSSLIKLSEKINDINNQLIEQIKYVIQDNVELSRMLNVRNKAIKKLGYYIDDNDKLRRPKNFTEMKEKK